MKSRKGFEQKLKKVNIIPELALGFFVMVIGLSGLACALIQGEKIPTVMVMLSVTIAGLTIIFGSLTLKRRIEEGR